MSVFDLPDDSERAAALEHVAVAERTAAQLPGLLDVPPRPVSSVAIIGAGTMGGGIAMAFANAGIPAKLIDSDAASLERGLDRIRKNYAFTVAKGRLSQENMEARLALIQGAEGTASIGDADLVIEAVPEIMQLKLKLFREIDAIARPGAILATNTSGLDIDAIAAATSRPQDVVGAHFFSPANVMRLLEVVRARETSAEVMATMMSVGRTLKKVPVQARVHPGFIGNAMLRVYMREGLFLLEEGATPREVDGALTAFGFAMGQFTMGDMAGNDVGIDDLRAAVTTRPKDRRYPDLRIALCDAGRLGQKTGKGWYRYEPGDRTPHDDPDLARLVAAYVAQREIPQRVIGSEEILERCLFAMINEAADLLDKGVALRPSDIDAVYVTGYGFPAWRGGPLYFADRVGLSHILERVRHYHDLLGIEWTPAPLLVRLAERNSTFSELQ